MLENGYTLDVIYEMDLYYYMELMMKEDKPKTVTSVMQLP